MNRDSVGRSVSEVPYFFRVAGSPTLDRDDLFLMSPIHQIEDGKSLVVSNTRGRCLADPVFGPHICGDPFVPNTEEHGPTLTNLRIAC